MTRKKFMAMLAALPAGAVGLGMAAPHPDLKISWACVLERDGQACCKVCRFRDVLAGDLIQILNPDLPVHRDPDAGRRYRVVEGPKPTSDPSTMGDCYLVVEGV